MLKTRKLGATGLELGPLTVGTWGLCDEPYGKTFPEQVSATLTRALEQGITAFDMAPTWGSDGAAEQVEVAGVSDGFLAIISAARPAMCGAAIDVPW